MATGPSWKSLDAWCREMAASRGGLCLTEIFYTPYTPVTWRCAAGHTWDAPATRILRWCPECAKATAGTRRSRREEVCRRVVRSHRSVVLGFTDPTMSARSRFRIRCLNGHVFDMRLDLLMAGAWCPACARKKADQRERYQELRAAQKFALNQGGALLTEEFVDPMLELEWRCVAGHTFTASWFRVQRRPSFCPDCERMRLTGQGHRVPRARDPRGKYPSYTLADVRAVAKKRGGRCLSKHFYRLADPLEWECAKGHRWTAKATCVVNGTWCRQCAYEARAESCRKYTVEDCTALVAARGGRCVSERFVHSLAKLEWECSEGHRFQQDLIAIKKGRWCRECKRAAAAVVREQKRIAHNLARRVKVRQPPRIKGSLEEMQERARALGGRCLATEYRGKMQPIEWECAAGHRWFAKPMVAGVKTWCRTCRYKETGLKRRRYTLADCQEMARARGGRCLSEVYLAAHDKMEWECAEGHRWSASSETVREGHWCSACAVKVVAKKRLKTLAKRKREEEQRKRLAATG